jgi:HSP20 family molecular chaperone IbpA
MNYLSHRVYDVPSIFDDIFKPNQSDFSDFGFFNDKILRNRINGDGRYEIVINVVGHEPKNIDVSSDGNYITVKAETEENSFATSIDMKISIAKDFDSETIEAEIKNGILTILMDKKESKKTKSIKVRY